MTTIQEIRVPDVGGATDIDVIEVLVSSGDKISKDDSLITLESEKASMEVPSPYSGTVVEVKVKEGDKVSQDDVIVLLERKETAGAAPDKTSAQRLMSPKPVSQKEQCYPVEVPDVGGATAVDVIEVLVASGQSIKEGEGLIVLESDKASMEIPAPFTGTIKDIKTSVGDKVSQGNEILTMLTKEVKAEAVKPEEPQRPAKEILEPVAPKPPKPQPGVKAVEEKRAQVYAGPAVRRFARELGVELAQLMGSGHKGRILKEDIQGYVKNKLQAGLSGAEGLRVTSPVTIDFAQFGPIEKKPLNRIKRITGQTVYRSWITVPQVTQFDEADITALESFRKSQLATAEKQGFKLTLLAFIVKAIAKGLQTYPQFNTSLDETGEHLIYKQYCNVGIAVDTPNGLIVPVLRQVDQKGVFDIAKEMAEISERARKKSLKPQDMQGGCITISSLGGIGGIAFTPIVNAPDVAILGVSRSKLTPVFEGDAFAPRLILPLSLSYDHRVIDGAEAARFTGYLAACLSDLRRLLL